MHSQRSRGSPLTSCRLPSRALAKPRPGSTRTDDKLSQGPDVEGADEQPAQPQTTGRLLSCCSCYWKPFLKVALKLLQVLFAWQAHWGPAACARTQYRGERHSCCSLRLHKLQALQFKSVLHAPGLDAGGRRLLCCSVILSEIENSVSFANQVHPSKSNPHLGPAACARTRCRRLAPAPPAPAARSPPPQRRPRMRCSLAASWCWGPPAGASANTARPVAPPAGTTCSDSGGDTAAQGSS